MGENLKISNFFSDHPPSDKMYHICLKSFIDCMRILLLKY